MFKHRRASLIIRRIMPDSALIDNAIIAKLGADVTLLSYCPNGAFMDEGPEGMTRLVVVSLREHHDEPMLGATAYEEAVYHVEAQLLSTTPNANTNCRLAAARIDALLHYGTLTVAGFSLMLMRRESRERVTERDDVDQSILWYRRGGNYAVVVSP